MAGPMAGKVCVVTGATSGIGWEAARGLAVLGATVVLGSRDPARGSAAKAKILAGAPDAAVEVGALDLIRFASVRRFADHLLATYPRIDVLVNNAGIYTAKRTVTEDGLESTFQTNHLGPFLLTNLLLKRIKASAPARVVNVASEANRGARLDLEDPNLAQRWSGIRAYCNSKLMNILHAFELARRLAGTGVTANAMHPGVVRTNWARHGGGLMGVGVRLGSPFLLSAAKGADTVVWLASSAELDGATGKYWFKREPIAPKPIADPEGTARRLWDLSETLLARGRPATPS